MQEEEPKSQGNDPMKVKEAMHQSVQWVEPNTPLTELARLMREHDIGAIPIGENDRLVGMVTDRDIVCRCIADGRDISKATARDVMSKGILYCGDEQELDEAAQIMASKQVRRLPVINDDRRMVGMLSLGDMGQAGPRELTGKVMQAVSGHHS
jgi:CBS domain-containing protein